MYLTTGNVYELKAEETGICGRVDTPDGARLDWLVCLFVFMGHVLLRENRVRR